MIKFLRGATWSKRGRESLAVDRYPYEKNPLRQRLQTPSVWTLPVLLVVLLIGCGPNYGGRQAIKGTIKLKGQPLDQGLISFMPISGDRTTQEGAPIANGGYKIDRSHGLMPGKYRVSITSGDGRTPASAPPDQAPGPTGANIISKDRVPPEYNTNSKQEVDVTEKGPNVFDFDIP